MAILDLGRVLGKSAYEYAVDGGYSGTEKEFKALMADAATKEYVDGRFHEVAPVIVTADLLGDHNVILKTYHVKAYPVDAEIQSYSLNFTVDDRSQQLIRIVISPPPQHAFTGIYSSSGLFAELNGYFLPAGVEASKRIGLRVENGCIVMYPSGIGFSGEISISGSFVLEVA